jgi:Ca2+-binding RTX toxin-like protein
VLGPLSERRDETVLRRVTLMLTLAAITAVVATIGAGGAPAAEPIDCAQQKAKVCKGTSGNDLIYGSQGIDDINPFGGNDTVYANGGDDSVRHSYGDDIIWGGTGADTLRGGFGNDTIYGNKPAATLTGAQSDDIGDSARDLIDCAYLASRGDSGLDVGYGGDPNKDVVVDCFNRDL